MAAVLRQGIPVPGPGMPPQSMVAAVPSAMPFIEPDLMPDYSSMLPAAAALSGSPPMPGGGVPIIGIPNSQDYPRLSFAAPYFNMLDAAALAGGPFLPIVGGTLVGPLISNIPNLVTTGPESVGQGALYINTVRTGGYGQYGNALFEYTVTAPIPTNDDDVGLTSWITPTNLTGGQAFGGWLGANTPARNLGQTYTGGEVIGAEINYGNRWADFGFQADVGGGRATVGLQVVPDVIPSIGSDNSVALTAFTTGSPAVFTLTGHGFYANMGLSFEGTAGISGIIDNATYYVSAAGLTANNFQVSNTIGGPSLNTTGTPVGALRVLPSWPGSFGIAQGASLHGHQTYIQYLSRTDSLAPGGYTHYSTGGSVAGGEPAGWAHVGGNFSFGIDMSAAAFSSAIAISMPIGSALRWGTASITGASGAFAISTAGSGDNGNLYGNNFAASCFSWGVSGSTPYLSFFGGGLDAKQTITGALSLVTDANARSVLTSLIQALTLYSLVANGTT